MFKSFFDDTSVEAQTKRLLNHYHPQHTERWELALTANNGDVHKSIAQLEQRCKDAHSFAVKVAKVCGMNGMPENLEHLYQTWQAMFPKSNQTTEQLQSITTNILNSLSTLYQQIKSTHQSPIEQAVEKAFIIGTIAELRGQEQILPSRTDTRNYGHHLDMLKDDCALAKNQRNEFFRW